MATKHYTAVRNWIEAKMGSQSSDYFTPTSTEPTITYQGGASQPDVVGVRYERKDTQQPSYTFHHYYVNIGSDPETIGKTELLRSCVRNGKVAADSVRYYVAVPGMEIPAHIREWAKTNGIGLLTIKNGITEHREADSDERLRDHVSNRKQQSPGNFKGALEQTPILKYHITDPDQFYDALIRPDREEIQQDIDYQQVFRKIERTDAEEALEELVSYLKKRDNEVHPHSGKPRFFIGSNREFTIIPQNKNFKIEDEDGMLVRVESVDEFSYVRDGLEIEDFEDLKTYLVDRLQ